MKKGACPKCGSKDIRWFGGWFSLYDRYVCISCGYFEEYYRPKHLVALARSGRRVEPMPSED